MFSTITLSSVELILRGLAFVPTPTGPITHLNSWSLQIPRLAYDVLGREAFGWRYAADPGKRVRSEANPRPSLERVLSSLRMDWFLFMEANF